MKLTDIEVDTASMEELVTFVDNLDNMLIAAENDAILRNSDGSSLEVSDVLEGELAYAWNDVRAKASIARDATINFLQQARR